jgi:hypothetical protein
MRFNKLYEKKLNPEQTAVSPGVQTLGADQWMGTYKWSKDVAGHDGDKQHAPESPSGNDVYTDKAIVVGYSDTDDKMTKAAMNGKVKQTVGSGSEEPENVNAKSPLSKNEDVSKGLPDHLKKHFDKDGNPIKGSWKDGKWAPNKDSDYQVKDVTPKGYGPTEDIEEAQNIYHLNRTGFARGPRDSERHDLDTTRPAPQEWALKINGKVWSKDGKTVTFNSKEQALKVRQSLLAKRPELEVGLVTRGGTTESKDDTDVGAQIADLIRKKNSATSPVARKNIDSQIAQLKRQRDKMNEEQGVAEGKPEVDSLVTDTLKIMQGPEFSDAELAIKTVLGERAYNERRSYYSFYVSQLVDMYGKPVGSKTVDSLVTKSLTVMRGPTRADAIAALKTSLGNDEYKSRSTFYKLWVDQAVDKYGQQGTTEGLNEFAPDNGDGGNGGEEDALLKYAKLWYNGDLGTQQQVEKILDRLGWEIGELESEEGGAFVVQSGDEHGDSYIGFSSADLIESKIKGADGKACWDGYRYNGTEDGKDSCVKVGEASLATMRDFFAGDDAARDPYEITKQRVHFSKDKNNKPAMDKRFQSKEAYLNWLQQQKQTTKEDTVDEDVIYRLDKENPMNDTEVLVIGGAGRYSLDGLRNKARKEVEQLAKDLAIDHGGAFRRSAHNVRQLQNTLNTIVAAYDELNQLRKLGGQRSKGIKDEDATVVREGVELMEKWTQKYKNSINCSDPKGFSQKAHCASKKK